MDNVVRIRKPVNSAYRSHFSVQAIGIASVLNTEDIRYKKGCCNQYELPFV